MDLQKRDHDKTFHQQRQRYALATGLIIGFVVLALLVWIVGQAVAPAVGPVYGALIVGVMAFLFLFSGYYVVKHRVTEPER